MILLIDGQDSMNKFGAYVTDGGARGLMEWPSLKQPLYNEWQEHDGREVDLSNPVLDKRNFSILMASADPDTSMAAIRSYMATMEYHTLTIQGSHRYTIARFMSASGVSSMCNLATFALNFCCDDPLQQPVLTPFSTIPTDNSYKISNPTNTGMIPLTRYGVHILKGTAQSFMFVPEVRHGVETTGAFIDGSEYENNPTTFRSPEVTLRCLMHESTPQALNRNYDALLHDLTTPGAKQLYASVTERTYPFHYVSQSVTEYAPSDNWIKFNVKLRILDNIR